MPRTSQIKPARKKPERKSELLPRDDLLPMKFKVLVGFKKREKVGPVVTPGFLYASCRFGETVLQDDEGPARDEWDEYSAGDVFELKLAGYKPATGTQYQERHRPGGIKFTRGELNQLLERKIIKKSR